MSDKQMLRKNITNGNFCGKNHYVDVMVDSGDITEQCNDCPPGKNSWYVEGPPPRILKKIGNYEMDQLIQCSGGDTVSPEFLKTLDPNFDERGAMGVPTWKEKQQAANIKQCKLDPVIGKVEDNETCQPVQSNYKHSDTDADSELSKYYKNYEMFEKCIRKKSRDMDAGGEYSLIKQLTNISKSYTNDCLETLPPIDYCDIGYSEMFLSTPPLIIEENGYNSLRDEDQEDYDRTTRQMVRYAYEEEMDVCGDVSDQTRSLYNMSNQAVSFKINIGDLWPSSNARFKDYLSISFKWIILSIVLYWLVKLIK